MSEWEDEMVDFEEEGADQEIVDQIVIENLDEDAVFENDLEVPDVWWAENIKNIRKPMVREKAIRTAQRWLDEYNRRIEKFESENKDFAAFWAENPDLMGKAVRASTRCALGSEGITYEHLGDLSEDAARLQGGDLEFVETKDRLKRILREVDLEEAKRMSEKVIEKHELSEDDAESLRRLIRLREMEEI